MSGNHNSRQLLSELDHKDILRSLINPISDHFILDLKSDKAQFFDLVADPNEQKDLAASLATQVEKRKSELKKFTNGLTRRSAGVSNDTDKEHLEQLKTLGYLGQ